ncbi:hypothetical protein QQS21_012874 [Conoideocrella luteorostrata]|uniref:Wings apart-like protein C-terminal domain-containing protein n=1 Tax=Conoideocrella luteorostrata TaxID=1105319 RepID=A0AAJ0CD33_9HYPO|nr:hypothetical protein QQS21_012874 [Conoideocrella luteorostrata]
MASPHIPNSSSSIGQSKLLTYSSSSRKRPLHTKDDHDLDSSSSKSKLAQPCDISRSPRSNTRQTPKSSASHVGNLRRTAAPSISKSPSAGASPNSSSRNKLLQKRDHTTAFAMDHTQDNFKQQRLTAQGTHTSCSRVKESTRMLAEKSGHNPNVTPPQQRELTQSSEEMLSASRHRHPHPASSRITHSQNTKAPSSRRPRLIDTLAAQKATMPADHADSDESEPDQPKAGENTAVDKHHSLPTHSARIRNLDRRGTTPTNRKVRFTYSQSRKIGSESHTPEVFDSPNRATDDTPDPILAESHAISPPPPDVFALDESDDDETTQPAIKSVHELRRAGANNRFADEMDDLISRIGLPGVGTSTMRRNALCELVQRLQRKDFLRQFRDHASRDTVARDIGKEEDIVCGFALVAALLSFLTSGPAPNLLRQLAGDGVGKLLSLLLRVDEDISAAASRKNMNMSRMSRSLVGQVKTILQGLPIWHGYQPADISPRTAALQLMALLSRCANAALLDQILLDSQQEVISVAAWASEEGSYDEVDYALTVFTLQTQSSAGVAPRLNSDGGHPTRIAKLLSRAFLRWPSGRTELDSAILKLALNTTNTESEAAAFDDSQLSARLAYRISDLFTNVYGAVGVGRLESEKYDELLLMLGVMINIMEYCSQARRAVTESAMDKLIKLWQENQLSVSEADSVNKSKLSVAVGYLSMLLGYMCLAGQAREQLELRVGRGGLNSLRGSIQQFVHLYKAVDSKAQAMDDLVEELRRIE